MFHSKYINETFITLLKVSPTFMVETRTKKAVSTCLPPCCDAKLVLEEKAEWKILLTAVFE